MLSDNSSLSELEYNKKLLLEINRIRADMFQHPVRHSAASLDLLSDDIKNRIEEIQQ